MMLPIAKVMLALGAAIVGFVITVNSTFPKGQNSGIQICAENDSVERNLREAAQKALDAIGSKRIPFASKKKAARGQHVFNNGLLGFHRSVLQDLLRVVGGYDEQLVNLVQDLMIPLTRTQQNAISTMVAHFRSDEFYVDYNADLFGEFVRELRNATVEYLKADTSYSKVEKDGIQAKRQRVWFIATAMVEHNVYVDPMACKRWLQEIQRAEDVQLYNQVREALKFMFQNILKDFQKVSDKIRVFRKRNSWRWD